MEKELREFLECGQLPYGFLRAYCKDCGRSLLVPFSCKRRGACCSCGARRMCNNAAHLVDHVLPNVPVRQFVLSVAFELRWLLAARADAFGDMTRIFIQEVFRWQREQARRTGLKNVRSGGLAMQHRAGSSINLNPHIHAAIPDGVFLRPHPKARAEFHRLPEPTPDDLQEIAFTIHQRFLGWLRRNGLLKTDHDSSHESRELSPLEAFAQGALGLGQLVKVKGTPRDPNQTDWDEERFDRGSGSRRAGEYHGFSLYAGEAIPATDGDSRERLLRYCLRPPLSLDRLSRWRDGSIVYRVKATRHGNETQRVMQPMQFMARLVALIPPPYRPLLRYFGVFAPHSSWRSSVVPELAEPAGEDSKHEHAHAAVPPTTASEQTPAQSALLQSGASDVGAAMVTVPAAPSEHGKSNWGDDDSEPPPSRPRWYIDWAALLRRVYDVDALACPCGGRLRFVALVTEEETARTMLQGMGLPADPPPIARTRSPAFDPDPLPNWD
ncbi:transposase [Myxococcota bacterium]